SSFEGAMLDEIAMAKNAGDSVGGIIEGIAFNLPIGLGDAMFEGLEGKLSCALFGIPAVKAVEFGSGFNMASMKGSAANDIFYYDDGKVKTLTNHNGGINGGISNGMPLTFRIAVKPTPSIAAPQKTVDLEKNQDATIQIEGRHDACIVPRVVPVVEAVIAISLLDSLLEAKPV
ncbi:MAG: chorismate synthase, partial [Clostridia bacterium]|nr:chorismate synthase [Clostridia bacterium]